MSRIVIVGNSGSGKSTLAQQLCQHSVATHFDLDSIAWLPTQPPTRKPIEEAQAVLEQFIFQHESWVIEGCYADLVELVQCHVDLLIFMKLPTTQCCENAKQRPWEPHKYPSKEAQDANLPMLLDWITAYETRDDALSLKTHQALYDNFTGQKILCQTNEQAQALGVSQGASF